MGTAGFVTFVTGGIEKTAYSRYDSYPAALGLEVLGWLRTGRPVLPALAEQVAALRVLTTDSVLSAEDAARIADLADTAAPAAVLGAGVIADASVFPLDSLFAEWGDVIDLDTPALEVYRGFQTAPHDKGRFASRPAARTSTPMGIAYYPVALVASWPLDKLPDDAELLSLADTANEREGW